MTNKVVIYIKHNTVPLIFRKDRFYYKSSYVNNYLQQILDTILLDIEFFSTSILPSSSSSNVLIYNYWRKSDYHIPFGIYKYSYTGNNAFANHYGSSLIKEFNTELHDILDARYMIGDREDMSKHSFKIKLEE